VNEAIQLGDDIVITVVSIDADRVKLGIEAPRSLRIFRKELLVETAGVNREAAEAATARLSTDIAGLKDIIAGKDISNDKNDT
jgi:carbon storage regulator